MSFQQLQNPYWGINSQQSNLKKLEENHAHYIKHILQCWRISLKMEECIVVIGYMFVTGVVFLETSNALCCLHRCHEQEP